MTDKDISTWLRQNRFRGKSCGAVAVLNTTQVREIIASFNGECAYCGGVAEVLDAPFPVAECKLMVQANAAVCCVSCKSLKHTHSLIWMWEQGHIEEARYVGLIKKLLTFDGGELLKAYLKRTMGFS